jgi:hypothetical protein
MNEMKGSQRTGEVVLNAAQSLGVARGLVAAPSNFPILQRINKAGWLQLHVDLDNCPQPDTTVCATAMLS